MISEKLKEAPSGRLSVIYGLWTVVLQAIFSMVYIGFSFFVKRYWARVLPGEHLPALTSLTLNIFFQAFCCCITLCIACFDWWKGRGMTEKQIKYLLLLMTMDAIWGWLVIRYAIRPMFFITTSIGF
jgi:hypothetical protein